MNREAIQKIVWYTLGALAGGTVGVVIATVVAEQVLDEEIDWEVEEELLEEQEEIITERPEKKRKKKGPTDYTGMYKGDKEDLHELVKRYHDGDPDAKEEDKLPELEETEDEEEDLSQPHLISKDEFETEVLGHTKNYLKYYEVDDTLTEDNGTVIMNAAEKFLGEDALVSFGEDEDEPDVVYVRNFDLESDYKITMIHDSYQNAVLLKKKDKKKHVVAAPKKAIKKEEDDEEEN